MRSVSDFKGETRTIQRFKWIEYALMELELGRSETVEILADMEGLSRATVTNLIYTNFQGKKYRRTNRNKKPGNRKGWYVEYKKRRDAALVNTDPTVKEIVKNEEEGSDEFVY